MSIGPTVFMLEIKLKQWKQLILLKNKLYLVQTFSHYQLIIGLTKSCSLVKQ